MDSGGPQVYQELISYYKKSQFEYESLESGDFRLLRLLRSRTAEIECELVHATFHSVDCPSYEALSYTWGSPELVEPIQVNGKILRVTNNLHTALRHLRLYDKDRILWIDAVCIDQTNDQERGHQVQRMGEIFRNAERVVIWLGQATAEINIFMHWLCKIGEQIAGDTTMNEGVQELLCTGLRTLLQRPWFTRVWVVQEVANAKSAVVCAGGQCVPAHWFARAPVALGLEMDSHRSSLLDLMRRTSNVESRQQLEWGLDTLLLKFQGCEASDERDKVYALRAMASLDEDAKQIEPDYTAKMPVIAQRTVRYLTQAKRQSIGNVLDFLGSFSSLTTICYVADRGTGLEKTREIPDSDLKMRAFLSKPDRTKSDALTAYWIIEPQSKLPEDETYDSQATQLKYLEAELQTRADAEFVKTMTWNGVKQNVFVVFAKHGIEGALRNAAARGYAKCVDMLLEHGADVNAQGGLYGTALQAASLRGYKKVVKMLLQHGADTNAQGGHYGNALQAASFIGDEKVVEMLLQHGADTNAQGGHFGNALQAASYRGDEKVVEMLLQHGADVNKQGGFYGNALQAASFRGDEKVVEMLLQHGADTNAQGGHYGNALQAASFIGDEKVVEMLLQHGADTNAQEGLCDNALQAASEYCHKKVVQMLLANGAEPPEPRRKRWKTSSKERQSGQR